MEEPVHLTQTPPQVIEIEDEEFTEEVPVFNRI
jgi:hypothetical protein